jgi:hypothetical protein
MFFSPKKAFGKNEESSSKFEFSPNGQNQPFSSSQKTALVWFKRATSFELMQRGIPPCSRLFFVTMSYN